MFTGLIEEIGTLKRSERRGETMVLGIAASRIMPGLAIGDSVACNGVCLTVTSIAGSLFTVDVMPETHRLSSLKDLRSGSPINLERAMAANGRFGGHIVQGHVDGTAVVEQVEHNQNAVIFQIKPQDTSLFRYIIPKGSIAVDGISLTVIAVMNNTFTISIIPHTLKETVLAHRKPGDTVNLECDVLGKYVEHMLQYRSASPNDAQQGSQSTLTANFLQENGYM
ncbi:riboflavin synthase [Paenibacillus bovis]|uniref:Riboflavin synthase n=1 Tax=Paenibacillus bovis TaxID=1616788 RepID=A0A172ZIL4_9BACL|nr:riboflavin synthase [Paenibacillus bovis]ANF97486.1 riboflavin synthase subunit alpha [Paenibacillus bovis]